MHTRCFLSRDAKSIFLILKSNLSSLINEAEYQHIQKQIEFGCIDLLSLEPCDDRFRPLRLKSRLKQAITYYRKEGILTEILNAEKPKTGEKKLEGGIASYGKTLLKEIQKKWTEEKLWNNIAKEQLITNKWIQQFSKLKNSDFSEDNKEIIQDNDNIDIETWKVYYIYLVCLNEYLKQIDNLIIKAKQEIKTQSKK